MRSMPLQNSAGRVHCVIMSTLEITAGALSLPPKSRARLASQLLESIDARQQSRVDAIWAREVEARLAAYEAGDKRAIPAAEVLAYRGKR